MSAPAPSPTHIVLVRQSEGRWTWSCLCGEHREGFRTESGADKDAERHEEATG